MEQAVRERLQQVIDPETGVDVMRMRLIEDLRVDDETGCVRYRFRPSSPLCPLAVHLALGIRMIHDLPLPFLSVVPFEAIEEKRRGKRQSDT